MNVSVIIGFISGIGLCVGIRTVTEESKTRGMIQFIVTFLAPVLTILFCSKKNEFVFGGTDWEFLIQTAIIDKMMEPWMILMIYVILIGITIYNIIKIYRNKKQVNND